MKEALIGDGNTARWL